MESLCQLPNRKQKTTPCFYCKSNFNKFTEKGFCPRAQLHPKTRADRTQGRQLHRVRMCCWAMPCSGLYLDAEGMLWGITRWNWTLTWRGHAENEAQLMGGEGKENKGTPGTGVSSCGPEEEQVWAGQLWKSSWTKGRELSSSSFKGKPLLSSWQRIRVCSPAKGSSGSWWMGQEVLTCPCPAPLPLHASLLLLEHPPCCSSPGLP